MGDNWLQARLALLVFYFILTGLLLVLYSIRSCDTAERTARAESLGQLVVLGFDVAVFTPAPYRRPRLGRPSRESSSRGWLRA